MLRSYYICQLKRNIQTPFVAEHDFRNTLQNVSLMYWLSQQLVNTQHVLIRLTSITAIRQDWGMPNQFHRDDGASFVQRRHGETDHVRRQNKDSQKKHILCTKEGRSHENLFGDNSYGNVLQHIYSLNREIRIEQLRPTVLRSHRYR